ncbi:MAG: acyltransferase [Terracidiphilus sp.]|jgi:peptidoglycan/LPS O-acetylase OafA/YrhL
MAESRYENRNRSWSRIDGVDCLRALAIFYVLLNHIHMRLQSAHLPYTAGLPHQLVNSLVWQGQAGVQIFFAVSGFLITSTTIKRWGTLDKVRPLDFYLIRFARIAPLLLTLLAVLSLLHAIHLKHFIVSDEQGGLGNALFAALTLHVGLLEATKGYLPANWDILWSLSVEEMFYLFFPLFCWLLGRGKGLVLFLSIFVMIGPFARTTLANGNAVWKEYSYLGGMDAIALGCLTALIVARRPLSRKLTLTLVGFGLTLLVFCLCLERQVAQIGLERTGLGMSILAVGACMLIAAAAESRWLAPRILRPWLTCGRRSYEVYLTHMFVVFAFCDVFVAAGKPLLLVPVLFIVVIVLSGFLGELVARFYSEPASHWLRVHFGDEPEILGSVYPEDRPH